MITFLQLDFTLFHMDQCFKSTFPMNSLSQILQTQRRTFVFKTGHGEKGSKVECGALTQLNNSQLTLKTLNQVQETLLTALNNVSAAGKSTIDMMFTLLYYQNNY